MTCDMVIDPKNENGGHRRQNDYLSNGEYSRKSCRKLNVK